MKEKDKDRPNCVNCGKPLGKYINSVQVPFDCDVWAYLPKELKGREYKMMDSLSAVRARQGAMRVGWEKRLEQMEEARLKLAPGSNEPIDTHGMGKFRQDLIKSQAEEPKRSHYDVSVRIWTGRYGPDRRGLFHSQACAQEWANKAAGKLRKEGRI